MFEFAAAVFFLIITPGPGVLSTAGIGSAYGYKPGLAYVTGLWIGNNLVAALVVSGVAALALSLPWLRFVLLALSLGYLLYLAAKIAFAGAKIGFIRPDAMPSVWTGFALQPINPKAYAVHTTLFSGFAFMPQALGLETALKFLIMNAVWIPIHLVWLWVGVKLREMNLASQTQRRINFAMAFSMLAVVGLALVSQTS